MWSFTSCIWRIKLSKYFTTRTSRIFFNPTAWCTDAWRSWIRRWFQLSETGRAAGTHLKRSQSVTECREQFAIWRIFVHLHKLRASWKFTPLTFGVHWCPSDWTTVQLQRQKSSQTRSINTLRKFLISLQTKPVSPVLRAISRGESVTALGTAGQWDNFAGERTQRLRLVTLLLVLIQGRHVSVLQ